MTVTDIATKRRKRGIVEIRDELQYFQEEAVLNGWSKKIPCYRRPEEFTEMDVAVHQDEAQLLCYNCPLLALCNEYAHATKPKGLVLGGVSWAKDSRSAAGRPAYPDETPLNLIREERERQEAALKNAA